MLCNSYCTAKSAVSDLQFLQIPRTFDLHVLIITLASLCCSNYTEATLVSVKEHALKQGTV